MREEDIERLLNTGRLRIRTVDKEKIKSLIELSKLNVKIIKKLKLNEDSATVIFREIYESIRQLSDAIWWISGYEPLNHEISLDILKDLDIKEKLKLNQLNRLKNIRHDANYRGFKVSSSQAREMIEFWNKTSKEIIKVILDKIK